VKTLPEVDSEPKWWAGVRLEIGSMLDGLAAKLKPPRPQLPLYVVESDSVSLTAGGWGVVKFEGPEGGHLRYIRSIRVSGITPTTVAAGRGDIFVSSRRDLRGSAASLSDFSQGEWRDQATPLPLVGFYGRGELMVRAQEVLYVAFSSGTASAVYYASISYEEISIIAGGETPL
jgi:hypothetical protein